MSSTISSAHESGMFQKNTKCCAHEKKTITVFDLHCTYLGSAEELEDLQTAYVEFQGDMEEIINNVMCSTYEDEDRFSKIIKDWIKKKEVKNFPKFSKENKKSKESRKRKVFGFLV